MSEWISFEDKFPSIDEYKEVITFEYLTHVRDRTKIPHTWIEQVQDLHEDDDGVWSDTGGENFTQWMPLPKPPIKDLHK